MQRLVATKFSDFTVAGEIARAAERALQAIDSRGQKDFRRW